MYNEEHVRRLLPSNEDRETHLSLVASNRVTWEVYTEDPVMIRRLDKITNRVRETLTGVYYKLDKSQVSLKKKRVLTEEQRKALQQRAKNMRQKQDL